METVLTYLVHAQAYLLLFGFGYLLFYKRNPLPSYNRFYLLFSLLAAALLPLMPSYLSIDGNNVHVAAFGLPELVVAASGAVADGTETFSAYALTSTLVMWSLGLYYSIMVLILLFRLIRITGMIATAERRTIEGMRLVLLKHNNVPFSFFGWLFIPIGLENDPAFRHILIHEQAHARKFHSADILLTEILHLLFWMNPLFYFMRSELRVMHEFEADACALSHCERISYQQALVNIIFSGRIVPLTNPYNVSLIKKRMLMMNKNSKRPGIIRKLTLSISLVILTASAFLFQSFRPVKTELKIQNPTSPLVTEQTTVQDQPRKDSAVFVVVEEMPQFPGGSEAMMKFLIENIKYPEQARKDSIQGRVFLNFIVEADGKISNAKVIRGIGGGCDEEAVRVVSMMPAWTPGKQRGQNVRVSFNLPIMFALSKK